MNTVQYEMMSFEELKQLILPKDTPISPAPCDLPLPSWIVVSAIETDDTDTETDDDEDEVILPFSQCHASWDTFIRQNYNDFAKEHPRMKEKGLMKLLAKQYDAYMEQERENYDVYVNDIRRRNKI